MSLSEDHFNLESASEYHDDERAIRIHEWLRVDEITKLHNIFKNQPGNRLNYDKLREVLQDFNIILSDNEYKVLFLKINQTRDNQVDWSEFVSFLSFCFQQDDPLNQKEALISPISTDPIIKDSSHRTQINGIGVFYSGAVDDYSNPDDTGTYVTGSRDGQINFWSSDLKVTKTGKSKSIFLKYTPTCVLSIQPLSDVKILCISSTERELRFHDIMAANFNLRLIIRHLPFAVSCMFYKYSITREHKSKLILGDFGGNLRVIEYSSELRGPFQSKPGAALIQLTWSEVLRGKFKSLKAYDYNNLFGELVQQVFYSFQFDIYYAAAEYHASKINQVSAGMFALDARGNKNLFYVPTGITSFFLDEKHAVLVTGGPDTIVRIWDPFIPQKATKVLTGHHAGIVYIFVQPEETKIYSIDFAKTIKVWHLIDSSLLQTFSELGLVCQAEPQMVYYYNAAARELLVAGRKWIAIKCCPKLRSDISDGNTHAGPVSVVLYNSLFENVVTCGLDSYIIVWDPFSGKRQLIMKKCHTTLVYGETTEIEITAASFDPMKQLLITGARDGSLKVWNYNNAVCIRNMNIEEGCEVTAVFWVPDRILAVGWNHRVTEFADIEGEQYGDPKNWYTLHNDDITAAGYKSGETLVTGTYSGELVFWKLETGQPNRKFLTNNPNDFIKLILQKKKDVDETAPKLRVSKLVRRSISSRLHSFMRQIQDAQLTSLIDDSMSFGATPPREKSFEDNSSIPIVGEDIDDSALDHDEKRRPSIFDDKPVFDPTTYVQLKPSIQSICVLTTRPQHKNYGSVLVALENGMIQVYSRHTAGGYMAEFNVIHKTGDCCITMVTDAKNKYLFTGTAFGYIKIWLLQNFCIPDHRKTHVCMPKLRLQFIFLRKDRMLRRAKRVVRFQPEPMLLSSYKGHTQSITSIAYVDSAKIVISGSADLSVRLWTLGGRYLGTLGGSSPWFNLSSTEPVNEEDEYRVPPDIHKVASSTTLKVISGQYEEKPFSAMKGQTYHEEEVPIELKSLSKISVSDRCTYGTPLHKPLLGQHFNLLRTGRIKTIPVVNVNAAYIPIYSHLQVQKYERIERPLAPRVITTTKKLEFKEYYQKKK